MRPKRIAGVTRTPKNLPAANALPYRDVPAAKVSVKRLIRFIVLHNGDDLTLIRPLYGLAASDSVNLYEGCDRSLATCIAKGNVINYGGFPWIPQTNPFESGIK